MPIAKPVNRLTPKDWEKHPVWTFDLDNEDKPGRDETWMVPVKKLPAVDIQNGGCRAKATLSCGQTIVLVLWGVILDPERHLKMVMRYRVKPMTVKERREHLKPAISTFTIFVKDEWWHSDLNGPGDLTKGLGLTIQDILPITYDISAFVVGVDRIVKGKIPSPFLAYK